ncbi:MAG: response regulator [Candidatus Eremiobacteraeota bacterium]|nr:response regulator [Candidatus Eremiobacteraeota bacterium]
MSRHIFVVEDEEQIAKILRDYLVLEGYEVDVHGNGRAALEAFRQKAPDIMLLDLMMPEVDGLTVCKEVRKVSELPIIMITAKAEEIDRLLGLELGADDYICKPFSPREVVARVKANLRRWPGGGAAAETPVAARGLEHHPESQRYTYNGETMGLTGTEYKLLALMHASPGRVYSRAQLLDLCYDPDQDVSDRAIDSHVKNLRKKLREVHEGGDLIHSVYGVGYRFEP